MTDVSSQDTDSRERSGRPSLRLVVHDYVGHPFQVQLSRELARRGMEVLHLHCGSVRTGKGAVDVEGERLRIEGVTLSREFARYSPWTRLRQEREYGMKQVRVSGNSAPMSSFRRTRLFTPRSAFSRRPSGSAHVLSSGSKIFWGSAPERVLERRFGRLGAVIGNRFVALERSLLLESDAVTVISDGFLPALEQLGIPTERISVIENWAPIDELPLRPARQRVGAEARPGRQAGHSVLGDTRSQARPGSHRAARSPLLGRRRTSKWSSSPKAEGRTGSVDGATKRACVNFACCPSSRTPSFRTCWQAATSCSRCSRRTPERSRFPRRSSATSARVVRSWRRFPPTTSRPRSSAAAVAGFCSSRATTVDSSTALRRLLAEGDLRAEFGRRARLYAEDNFDIATIARSVRTDSRSPSAGRRTDK